MPGPNPLNSSGVPQDGVAANNFDYLFDDASTNHSNPHDGHPTSVRPSPGATLLTQSTTPKTKEREIIPWEEEVFKLHQPPPKREVEDHHHHHHVITVDSETDFDKMHINENKVNYLPYYPPAAVSQTGLIQSIGRPFNSNHAKNLPDPGDEFKLTRRVSQVRLYQVALLGDVNTKIIDRLAKIIKLLSTLIGLVGIAFFCFVVSVGIIGTPMEYSLYFLDRNMLCKMAHIFGVVQPFTVAPYCRYALINLKHIRTYFLRVPLMLCIPAGVIVCGFIQFTNSVAPEGDLKKFLVGQMPYYFSDSYASRLSRNTWDGIQNTFGCCGYQDHKDWTAHNASVYPRSCCSGEAKNCPVNSTDLKKNGCVSAYKGTNIPIALVFITFGALIIGLEILSVIFMRSLYACIGKELYDERSTLSIMGGKLCSLCDIEDTDSELEYDEDVEHHHGSSNEDEDHHHTKEAPKKSLAASAASKGTEKPRALSVGAGRGRGMGRGINKVAPAPH